MHFIVCLNKQILIFEVQEFWEFSGVTPQIETHITEEIQRTVIELQIQIHELQLQLASAGRPLSAKERTVLENLQLQTTVSNN
jgi:hypothetical protein